MLHLLSPSPKSCELVELRAVEIETPRHQKSKQLLAYWTECSSHGNGLVVGRDLPSMSLRGVLSWLYLLEPFRDRSDFRYRLAPSGLIRRFGTDVTGRRISELYRGPALDQYVEGLQRVIDLEQPVTWDVQARWSDTDTLHFERLAVPARSRALTQTWVLGGTFFF